MVLQKDEMHGKYSSPYIVVREVEGCPDWVDRRRKQVVHQLLYLGVGHGEAAFMGNGEEAFMVLSGGVDRISQPKPIL